MAGGQYDVYPYFIQWWTDYDSSHKYRTVYNVHIYNQIIDVWSYNNAGIVLVEGYYLDNWWVIPLEIFKETLDLYQWWSRPEVVTYLTISEDALITALLNTANWIVDQTGGGATADLQPILNTLTGFENTMYNMLGEIEYDMTVNTNSVLQTITTKLTPVETSLQTISSEVSAIYSEVVTGGAGIIETIAQYIGDLINTMYQGIQDLVYRIEDTYFGIIDWFAAAWDFMTLQVGSILEPIIETVNVGLMSVAIHIWDAVRFVMDPILDIIINLGDLYDWFAMEFMQWLDDTFTFDEADIKTGAMGVINVFKDVMDSFNEQTKTVV